MFAFMHWTVHRPALLCEKRTQVVFIFKHWFQSTFIKTDWRHSGNKPLVVLVERKSVCGFDNVSCVRPSSEKFPIVKKQRKAVSTDSESEQRPKKKSL